MIKIKAVYKNFGNEIISFNDIVFEDNKSYIILGPSGCGKSTLLNLLSGNIKADNGSIQVNTKNYSYKLEDLSYEKLQEYRRNNISYVSQEFNLFDNFTVYDNLNIINEIKPTKIAIEKAIKLVGLTNKLKQKVRTLSGGEKQRVCIARALLQGGDIILCDEPTASLNQGLANDIIKLIIELQKKTKSSLLVVTHDERLIENFDEVIYYEDFIKVDLGGAK
ncbi:ATP-binding cassette domain-containing protein [Clostridium septicum]|uniref:ATP-binding cassette domain-containing protein n=1 Tax=Clostridium septicum TaxID=1504 RepID=A0A9N7PLQ6_CLOSE|nr:ATP-binding cassette domain-containing protein [Clostridium septicum]AYE34097.1 macrolide ABC transporter ATP-binding protein [Clostridium septicum]MDU1313107.1 ATP-binding cassette domain-containing protein [Clostridium septicum]QAS59464.1 ATP-binding cassette domain-containing protein [Clostridium septicum]UEC21279.1 ATP-binding cassette domain-containing protein [Clostridium septicum]USS00677.1 ATP-binding cassette domain-containing protein [Clostridium septicum]